MPAKKRHAKKRVVKKHHVKKRPAHSSSKRSRKVAKPSKKPAAPKKRHPVQKQKIKPGPSPKAVRTPARMMALMETAPSPSPSHGSNTHQPNFAPLLQQKVMRSRY